MSKRDRGPSCVIRYLYFYLDLFLFLFFLLLSSGTARVFITTLCAPLLRLRVPTKPKEGNEGGERASFTLEG